MRIRRGLWLAGLVVAIAALAVILLPMVASTRIVRDRIAQELSSLTGYRVDVETGPDIAFWPSVTATLGGVTLSRWDSRDAVPVFETEELRVELSALAALSGDIIFSRMRLLRPTLHVTSGGALPLPPPSGGVGRIGHAIDTARAAIASNPAAPDLGNLPGDPLGIVEFSEGRILRAESSGEREVVTSIAGKIDWLALNRPAIVNLSGIWRGEATTLSLTAPKPLVLLAGGVDRLSVEVKANPLQASFDGRASLGAEPFVDGRIQSSAPSLKRLLEWSQSSALPGSISGPLSLSTTVAGTWPRLKFADAEIALGESRGVGALELSFADVNPSVAGTLAFGRFDLGAFLTGFTPLRAGGGVQRSEIEDYAGRNLNLDLRLSASQANWGTLQLANLAATAQVKDNLAVLDVSDASAFDGSVQAGLRMNRLADGNEVEIRMLADNVDAAAFASGIGLPGLDLRGRATMSLMLKGNGRDWDSVFNSANGSASARIGQATVNGVDLGAFLERVRVGEFFALRDVTAGSFPLEQAELKAEIVGGAAWIDRAHALTPNYEITLGGIVPYVGGGLALSGRILQRQPQGDGQTTAGRDVAFFVGGSWGAPIISPILTSWPSE